MATPITGGTAFDFGEAAQAAVPPPTASVRQPTKAQPAEDSVKLSDGAQVQLLNSQGQTVAQISINTDLPTETVNSYLGITQPLLPPVTASNK
jgi:hypothetical protein